MTVSRMSVTKINTTVRFGTDQGSADIAYCPTSNPEPVGVGHYGAVG